MGNVKLTTVLRNIEVREMTGNADICITGINIDSRKVEAGNMFVAVRGTQTDGHKYIPTAMERGAAVIVCEAFPDARPENVTFVRVDSTEDAEGKLATAFYGYPSEKLKLIGVTGTNGKTTIATLLYKLFSCLGYKCGLCSTVCNYVCDTPFPTECTTPDAITLNELLSKMVEEGCKYAFMECSSHSIQQKRIGGLKFAGGIFTNLTRDHLDYHKTFENYRDAKKKFFDGLGKDAFAIVNIDDRNGLVMVQNTKAATYTYSQMKMADFHARIVELGFEGTLLNVNGTEVFVPLVGKFNVSNVLAIYAAAVSLGVEPIQTLTILSKLSCVSGRFETLRSPRGYVAIVDYAHTPDALVNVLNAINDVLCHKGEVITVCGAGGNRDKGKRPIMAYEAARLSDKVIITSDNPRFEDPQEIINDMLVGINEEQKGGIICNVSRADAIKTACMLAKRGDVVLVAGKGHEPYQEINGVKHHFDDKEILQDIFKREK